MSETVDQLRILHQTVYRYHRPVTFLTHRLVLRPREGHDLRVPPYAVFRTQIGAQPMAMR